MPLVRLLSVQKLISYTSKDKEKAPESFTLEGDLQVQGPELVLEFSLGDPQSLFDVPKTAATWNSSDVVRKDGLWQATCFEAFLQPSGQDKYYEFNFALNPAWNAYEFSAYREPQPPTPTADFVLKTMSWDPVRKYLRVRLENEAHY